MCNLHPMPPRVVAQTLVDGAEIRRRALDLLLLLLLLCRRCCARRGSIEAVEEELATRL
jgi:hypothetical protein